MKKHTEEEIRQMAKDFCDKHLHFLDWEIFCDACGAENWKNNITCIKCNCQL